MHFGFRFGVESRSGIECCSTGLGYLLWFCIMLRNVSASACRCVGAMRPVCDRQGGGGVWLVKLRNMRRAVQFACGQV